MKYLFIFTLLSTCIQVNAQGDRYTETMKAAIAELYSVETSDGYDPIINKFQRIGEAEGTAWEPFYYASLGHLFKGNKIEDLTVRDASLDQALAALEDAATLAPDNVEIILLEGFINMIKIGVDPTTRGQSLSPKIMASFGRALQMAPDNPRANLFMAQMQIGTAQFFGTSIEEPCLLIEKAGELFENAQPTSALVPNWGAGSVDYYRTLCAESQN